MYIVIFYFQFLQISFKILAFVLTRVLNKKSKPQQKNDTLISDCNCNFKLTPSRFACSYPRVTFDRTMRDKEEPRRDATCKRLDVHNVLIRHW